MLRVLIDAFSVCMHSWLSVCSSGCAHAVVVVCLLNWLSVCRISCVSTDFVVCLQ